MRNDYKSPAYFHARDLGCLLAIDELADVEMDDIYMANETYFLLTKEHIELMKKRKFWDYVHRARVALIAMK